MIRSARPEDAKQILSIYSYYVFNSHSTFEVSPPSAKEMTKKIRDSEYPWLVYENEESEIVGYSYATRWKMRKAYDRTAETSVYLHKDYFGKGIAKSLYQALLERLREMNLYAILAGISMPNDASVRLHEKFGFKKVGQLEQVGNKFDRWIDVGYWQLILD